MRTEGQVSKSRPFRVHGARDFGAAVKHFRSRAGLTQADLAARAGIHRAYLSELEGGRTTEALERLMTLFRELGVRVTLAPEAW
jgi:transcriptional regulator with XRE-family HTH domain